MTFRFRVPMSAFAFDAPALWTLAVYPPDAGLEMLKVGRLHREVRLAAIGHEQW